MIDLRSDTLTKPTVTMRQAMYNAEVGDDGRTTEQGKGEDPTVNALENLAAEMTGKENALFCPSGSMANIIALLTHCDRGNDVALDQYSHIYQSEKSPFMEKYFGLNPIFYQTDPEGIPKQTSIQNLHKDVGLLCLENSNSFYGGTCMSIEQTEEIGKIVKEKNIPIHLDGARIFNVAAHFKVNVSELAAPADTVMFCLSKGLGAPFGSMLCGSNAFIMKARGIRKLLGGGMRQAGVIAAAGIIAIREQKQTVRTDNEHASFLAGKLRQNNHVKMKDVQTNIIVLDVTPSGYSAFYFEKELAKKGLRVKLLSDRYVRMTLHRDISKEAVIKASNILNEFLRQLPFPKKGG